jgi:hypothetical protein
LGAEEELEKMVCSWIKGLPDFPSIVFSVPLKKEEDRESIIV